MPQSAQEWRVWLERHGAALLLFAAQWSSTRSDAEDAMQTGFLRFWQTREKARDEVAYLYTCVRGAAIDLGRGQRRRQVRETAASLPEPSSFDIPSERFERESAIEAALRELPADQREVIVMKIWGDLTFAQIAQALDIPLNTAASRYRYAIRRLENELSSEVGHE